jgi:hypothetical protein
MERAELNPNEALRCILAGSARFTVENTANGNRFTHSSRDGLLRC